MHARYVWRDLTRNPRRTLVALVGVALGLGLFSGVLFFIDGSGASMTRRALAPLAIDMQRVLTSPLGGGLRLTESVTGGGPLRPGQRTGFVLVVSNTGEVAANEIVVRDEPAAPLTYVAGSTRRDGRPLPDVGATSPLAHGLARTGLNIGTLPPHRTARLTYAARATVAIPAASALRLQGTVSSRENLLPAGANVAAEAGLDQLGAQMAGVPGVAAVDRLSFVDLPGGSLSSRGSLARDAVRVFAFDDRYAHHYPSIRLLAGALRQGAGALSAEAARALGVGVGGSVELRLPDGTRAGLPVSAITDLSRARPLFYSRKSSNLEDFLYSPNSLVVDPETFTRTVLPAFRRASAAHGSAPTDLPLLELDVLLQRPRLRADPASALRQTQAVAHRVREIAPGQDYLIDNASNTLQVARDDAAVAKRMFLFLGLPGAVLAAFLAAYAGSVLAAAQRREQANLRIRGAGRGHLLRMLLLRTLALASAGSVAGTTLGLLAVMAILGPGTLLRASNANLATSALLGVGLGLLATGLALYVPGRRGLRREISQERGELALTAPPAWRRLRLDLIVLVVVVVGELVALRGGAFDAPAASVYSGRGVSLPSYLLLAPVAVWLAGSLIALRGFDAGASRLPVRASSYGSPVYGTLVRSLRRRSWSSAGGVLAVGLIVAFGVALAVFATTYDAAKARDARFIVGSDLRVTAGVQSSRNLPPGFAAQLQGPGVASATPVVAKLENAVLVGPFNEDHENLAAIDPRGFMGTAALADSFFPGSSASRAMASLQAQPRGVLVAAHTAEDLKVAPGDQVQLLLARGTRHQSLVRVRVLGLFTRMPGFPQGLNLLANLGFYATATRTDTADFFLARSADPSPGGLARAVAGLRSGPGRRAALSIETSATTLDKDQSSLTALNVHGLVDLDRLFTLLMAAAAIVIFVFGLMLQRRREYVTLRAQGLHTRELAALVLGEAAVVTFWGLVAGIIIGAGMGSLLVHVLRPLYVLDPAVTLSVASTMALAVLVLGAAVVAALAATALLRRLRPTELLREA